MSRPTHIDLNWSALAANFECVKQHCPQQNIMAVIKSNGYGHGLIAVAQHLPQADAFAVACLEEALQLRQAGIKQRLVVLAGFFEASELLMMAQQQIDCVLHHPQQVIQFQQTTLSQPLNIWLKIDTGMGRLGMSPDDLAMFWFQLQHDKKVKSLQLMSHMACADDISHPLNQNQQQQFATYQKHYQATASLANSASLLAFPNTHFDWVRAGIMLYGVSPFAPAYREQTPPLNPVMRLHSALSAVYWRKKGQAVGYASTWVCPEDMPVGIIPLGYGDGYPRHAKQGTPVLLNGQQVPLIGRVSMDMLTVDLRSQPKAKIGDKVLLWGDGLPVETIADHADTIAYELLTRVTQRVPRLGLAG